MRLVVVAAVSAPRFVPFADEEVGHAESRHGIGDIDMCEEAPACVARGLTTAQWGDVSGGREPSTRG
jgi:hypothetical protein